LANKPGKIIFRAFVFLKAIMKKFAIIPAGGSGKRLKTNSAKQYLLVAGLPVLVHTLKVFQRTAIIDEVILAVPEKDIDFVQKEIIKKYHLTKITSVVAGGAQRQDSVRNALAVINDDCDIVVVHDGVRPFVTEQMIGAVVAATKDHLAASIGVPAKDTIKETEDNGVVLKTVPRQNLWLTQTPQAFRLDTLKKAYNAAYSDNYYGTDDASLVERIGIKVQMVTGAYDNIKITTPEDLITAEALLKNRSRKKMMPHSGFGYDSHRFVPGGKLILGGVEIPFDKGLQGHSDADVLLHAVCDALLGATAGGDIGRHFPDTDPAFEGISSALLLERVAKMISAKGFSINNIDATIVMEKPKLAPFADRISANIAGILNLAITDVNIKAKTNEGMGFVGRNEGVAVFAIAAVVKEENCDE
jgi:2-C-methyl-D-erythritol 4-phosphate cytidylyltransferase / 2-C-methyl-D-erythritol 2,4-cyclodiphosphate synthase